jgi:proline iminopeptidase
MVEPGKGTLHFEQLGEGPPLLMMHGGLGLDHSYLRPAHDALARDHRVIYYDHRGNGRSASGAESIDHATWHADAAALLDDLGHPRAIVYGHSYGAWLALGFALAHPTRVSALILCGGAAAFDYAADVIASVQAGDPEVAAAFLGGLTSPPATDEEFRRAWLAVLPLYFAGAPRPDAFANTVYSAQGFRAGNEHFGSYNVIAQLPALHVPTLLVTGANDFITPPAQAHRIAAAARNAQVVVIPACGHFPFLEQPEAYFEIVTPWLRRQPRS